jgi:hypothetical protein
MQLSNFRHLFEKNMKLKDKEVGLIDVSSKDKIMY